MSEYDNVIMAHNAETGLFICQLPYATEALRMNEPDFAKAKQISDAIQKAYETGKTHGMECMQGIVVRCMSEVNRD